jgi:hypothetical protein
MISPILNFYAVETVDFLVNITWLNEIEVVGDCGLEIVVAV